MALKANQTDTIATAGGIDTDDTSFTLTTGAFDTKSSGDKVPLIIDYDNSAKLEVVIGYVSGTAVSSVTRAQDGTAAVAHSQNAKVCIGSIPTSWKYWFRNDNTQDSWTAPSLGNGWANSGGVDAVAGYMKDSMGFVHIKGKIKDGNSATTIFTLPSGYRPAAKRWFVCLGGDMTTASLTVDSSGNVVITASNTGGCIGLDGVSFLAEA